MIPENYYITQIDGKLATEIQIKHHYLRRRASVMYAFALKDKQTDEIKGVITYGMPPSDKVRKGICGTDEKSKVIELNRLWISDDVGKNAESWLVANSMKYVKYDIIISYADPSEGHLGTIYQALNGIYYGLSSKHIDPKPKHVRAGQGVHPKALNNKHSTAELKNPDEFEYIQRVQKHRYVFFNCDKRRKRELLGKLKYDIRPYPKVLNSQLNGISQISGQSVLS